MAKNARGSRQGAQQGRRATGASGSGERQRSGQKQQYRYTLKGKAARQAEDVPCPARGKHDKDCICGGSGTVKGTR